jgi:hypothetical protein
MFDNGSRADFLDPLFCTLVLHLLTAVVGAPGKHHSSSSSIGGKPKQVRAALTTSGDARALPTAALAS